MSIPENILVSVIIGDKEELVSIGIFKDNGITPATWKALKKKIKQKISGLRFGMIRKEKIAR